MQQGILFFALTLIFTWMANIQPAYSDNTKLDACFATTVGFPAMQTGCAQIKSLMASNFPVPDADCKTVAGVRFLGRYFQNNTPSAGSIQAKYLELYTQKVTPEYLSKCFPKKTTTGATSRGGTDAGTNAGNGPAVNIGQTGGQTAGAQRTGQATSGNTGVSAKDPKDADKGNAAKADDTKADPDAGGAGDVDEEGIAKALTARGTMQAGAEDGQVGVSGSTSHKSGDETGTDKGSTPDPLGSSLSGGGSTSLSTNNAFPTSNFAQNDFFTTDSSQPINFNLLGTNPNSTNSPFSTSSFNFMGTPMTIPVGATSDNLEAILKGIQESAKEHKVQMDEFKGLEGTPNTVAWNAMKASITKLHEGGKFYGLSGQVSQIQNAAQKYIEVSKTCSSFKEMADVACIEERSPVLKQVIESTRILAPVLQAATGLNDSCNKISRAMGKINKGLLVASVVCGGFQGACNLMCGSNKTQLEAIQTAIQTVGTAIWKAAEADVAANCATSTPACGPAQQRSAAAKTAMNQALTEYKKVAMEESNKGNPASLAGKIAKCGSFTDTLRKTTQSLLGLAQTNMQAKDCAKKTANNDNANKCQDPAHEGEMECLCQRAEFKSTASCRTYATGCPVAGQLKNSAGTCVALEEACKDPINAAKAECSTTVAAHCANAENANNKECVCLLTPNAVACGGNGNTTLAGGLTAGSTGTLNNTITPTNSSNNGGSPYIDGNGLQKMGTDGRSVPVSNLNGLSAGADRMNLGSDGNNTTLGADGSPTAYSDPSAGGAGASSGGSAGGGGLGGFGAGGRDPASEANGKGKAGGYKGASAEALGGGGGWGAGGGLNWGDREKNKNEALQKLNADREKARLAGLTTLKENGITGPTGKTLWEKVTTRYRESKATLIAD